MRVDIPNYEGLYQIDEHGNVYRLPGVVPHRNWKRTIPARILKHKKTDRGYFSVSICKDGRRETLLIHRLIAQAFIPNPENKPEVNHINGIKGDFSIKNLEWCTKKENIQHAVNTGLKKPSGACLIKGASHHKSKLNPLFIKIIREASSEGHTNRKIGNYFKVSGNQISQIIRGQNWKNI